MKITVLYYILFVLCITSSCDTTNPDEQTTAIATTYYKGMDLSFLPEMQRLGVSFKDENNQIITNNYAYLRAKGVNLVRIRLWFNHPNGAYNLQNLKAQALQVKAAGMDYLLDFHYSDTWADPGAQQTPAIWTNMNVNELAGAINEYTATVLQSLKDQGTAPAIIQIGNETNSGMLWPIGQIYTANGENFDNYATLTKAAISASRLKAPEAQIMIHHAGLNTANYFYSKLAERNVQFDIIGLSYYPWWHAVPGNNLQLALQDVASQQNQKIMIVETAYPFTLGFNDNTNNIVGLQNQVSSSYSATPSGQRNFMLNLDTALRALPDNRGIGFCYWAPDWVAHANGNQGFMNGSSWENLALFDFNLKVNPAIDVYGL